MGLENAMKLVEKLDNLEDVLQGTYKNPILKTADEHKAQDEMRR